MSVSETHRAPRLSITAEGAMYPPDQQARLLDVAHAADQAGVDYIETTEHVLMGLNALHAGQGWEPHHLEMPQPEVLTTLAAMVEAGVTVIRVHLRRFSRSPDEVLPALGEGVRRFEPFRTARV